MFVVHLFFVCLLHSLCILLNIRIRLSLFFDSLCLLRSLSYCSEEQLSEYDFEVVFSKRTGLKDFPYSWFISILVGTSFIMASTTSPSKQPDKNANDNKNGKASPDGKVKKLKASQKPAPLQASDGVATTPNSSSPSPTESVGNKVPPFATPIVFDNILNNARTSGNNLIDQVPKGFKNPGNLCYRNAAMVMLFSAAPFLGYFFPRVQNLGVAPVDGSDFIQPLLELIEAYTALPDPSDPDASDAACQASMLKLWGVIAGADDSATGNASWLSWRANWSRRRLPKGPAARIAAEAHNAKVKRGQQDAQEFMDIFLKNLQFQLTEGVTNLR